jgi:formiminoglutamase
MFIDERAKLHLFAIYPFSICQRGQQFIMELKDYLHPVDTALYNADNATNARTLINVLELHTKNIPDLQQIDVAIIGVEEHRHTTSYGITAAPDAIRKELYKLIQPKHHTRIADLGNIKAGESMNDTLYAVNVVVNYLLQQKVFVIVLGGTCDVSYAQYTAYQQVSRAMQVVCCDADIELLENEKIPEYSNYMHRIISHQPAYLFNISHLGAQQYFIEQESIDAFERMNFDLMRLGAVQQKMQDVEPLLRNADALIFSMNAVRASDAPASVAANPNGLYGEEACQILRYAGMGNDLTSLGIYDIDAQRDIDGRSAKLISQMLWYFIDGFYSRKHDYPTTDSNDYITYRTILHDHAYEIVFYKHALTDRWWMEVPYPNEKTKHQGKFMVPCNYNDYQMALKDEIPDRWMKAYQKLMI